MPQEEARRVGRDGEGLWGMGFCMWLSAISKSLPLLAFENIATRRDFVCPATLCFRGEAIFFFF